MVGPEELIRDPAAGLSLLTGGFLLINPAFP